MGDSITDLKIEKLNYEEEIKELKSFIENGINESES